MARCSDLVTTYDVIGVGNASGENNGTAVPVTGPIVMVAVEYTQGSPAGETGFVIYLEIGSTSSGPWHRCTQMGGATVSIPDANITTTGNYIYQPIARFTDAAGEGGGGGFAGPWMRAVIDITGSGVANTDIAVLLGFSGSAR